MPFWKWYFIFLLPLLSRKFGNISSMANILNILYFFLTMIFFYILFVIFHYDFYAVVQQFQDETNNNENSWNNCPCLYQISNIMNTTEGTSGASTPTVDSTTAGGSSVGNSTPTPPINNSGHDSRPGSSAQVKKFG